MAEIYVRAKFGPEFTAALASGVQRGSLVYHDGSRFSLADADSDATPAEYVCVGTEFTATTDKQGTLVRKAVIEDSDAPYTLGGKQYIGTTPGALLATRPTGDDDLSQLVGRAINTSQVEVEIPQPYEAQVATYRLGPIGGATPDTVFDTGSGHWVGMLLNAVDEMDVWGLRLPSNFKDIVIAEWCFGADTAVSPPINYSALGAHSGEDTDVSTAQAIADAAITGTADFLEIDDVSNLFAAAGGAEADAWMALRADHGSGTLALVSFTIQVTATLV